MRAVRSRVSGEYLSEELIFLSSQVIISPVDPVQFISTTGEGRHIHDYVDGKDVPWERVVGSVTNGWGGWAELQELIVWMREYNADPVRPRRLRFLDLRRAPREGPVAEWIEPERPDRSNLRYQPVAPGKAWDCFVFSRRVSIAEPQVPDSMRPGLGTPDPTRYDGYVGRYVLLGFLSQPTTMDITREGHRLFADGRDDTSGELFPPYRTELFPSDDGRFLWPNWPAILEFRRAPKAGRVSILMRGMGTYEGARGTL